MVGKYLEIAPHRSPGENLVELTLVLGKSRVRMMNHLGCEMKTEPWYPRACHPGRKREKKREGEN